MGSEWPVGDEIAHEGMRAEGNGKAGQSQEGFLHKPKKSSPAFVSQTAPFNHSTEYFYRGYDDQRLLLLHPPERVWLKEGKEMT